MPGSAPTSIKVIGDPVAAGLLLELTIPKVINVATQTLSLGYKNSQNVTDNIGNVTSVILSNYGAEITFEGDLDE